MSLTQGQQTTINNLKSALFDLVMAYNSVKTLIDKVDQAGNDPDLNLDSTRINSMISQYNDLRQAVVDKADALPIL